jgi:hypothetical protein
VKRVIFIIVILLFFSCNSENIKYRNLNELIEILNNNKRISFNNINKYSKKKYDELYKKWKSRKIDSYKIKVRYSAFSPLQGIWDIEIKNDEILYWSFNSLINSEKYKTQVEKMTINSLFNLAKSSYQLDKDNPFLMYVDFNDTIGYVKSVILFQNPLVKEKISTDKTYKIEIIDFKIMR